MTTSRERFTRLFRRATKLIDDNELANKLDTSTITVRRWRDGRNVPTPSVRKSILCALGY